MEFVNPYLTLVIFHKMRPKFFLKILIVAYLALSSCQAQRNENSLSMLQTDWDEYNLKGRVKEIATTFNRYYSDTLPEKTVREYEFLNSLDHLDKSATGRYIFNEKGFLTKSYRRYNDTVFIHRFSNRNLDIMTYKYDSLDIEKKLKIRGNKKFFFPVYSPYKIHTNVINDFERPNFEDLFFSYEYLIENHLVIEEKEYWSYSILSASDSVGKKNAIHKRTVNYFDANNLIEHQEIYYRENKPKGILLYDHIEHLVMDIPENSKVEYYFLYDDSKRITGVKLLVDKKTFWKENYIYKNDEQRPYKLKRYIESKRTFGKFYSDHSIEWYNEFGDITKAIDFDDSGNAIRTRFYDYKYDNQNNWIECSMYLEGKPERTEKPTIVAHRTITYYPDSEQKESEN